MVLAASFVDRSIPSSLTPHATIWSDPLGRVAGAINDFLAGKPFRPIHDRRRRLVFNRRWLDDFANLAGWIA
jgi:hypothetical protein